MYQVIAPALRGNDALGFLAALGVVALAEQGELQPVRLQWQHGLTPVAAFLSDTYRCVADLAQELSAVVQRLTEKNAAIPGVPVEFPYAQRRHDDTAVGADPMRMSREAARGTYLDAERDWHSGQPWFSRWVIALLALTSQNNKGICLTPFNAPFGQMKLRDSYYDQAREAIQKEVQMPGDAFTSWIRTERYTGANLDERAIRDASVATDGNPNNAGAPSPTWLAVMALRFFPMVDDGQRVQAVGWHDLNLDPYATKRTLVWPVWEPALDAPAIRTLLAHPDLDIEQQGMKARARFPAKVRALGVTALYGASRRTRTQGDGPLGPARRIWP